MTEKTFRLLVLYSLMTIMACVCPLEVADQAEEAIEKIKAAVDKYADSEKV